MILFISQTYAEVVQRIGTARIPYPLKLKQDVDIMVQPYIRPIKMERWFVLSIGSSLQNRFHPNKTLAESDGVPGMKCQNRLHPNKTLAEFDGASGMKSQKRLHPNKTLAESDGAVHSKYQSTRHEMPNNRLATQFELSK